MIVTIDGPAGSGKSTAARKLAEALGIAFLDTGATYRAVTWEAMRRGADLADEAALADVARGAEIRLVPGEDATRVIVDGRDVSQEIRSPEVTENSRHAAAAPLVREVLVGLQRRIGREMGSFVSEGRDQGSVVFPEADLKFFLDASPVVRARRRLAELRAAGQDAEYEQVLDAIGRRDRRDRGRPVAPLLVPDGAIEIDTTGMTIEEVTAELVRRVEGRR